MDTTFLSVREKAVGTEEIPSNCMRLYELTSTAIWNLPSLLSCFYERVNTSPCQYIGNKETKKKTANSADIQFARTIADSASKPSRIQYFDTFTPLSIVDGTCVYSHAINFIKFRNASPFVVNTVADFCVTNRSPVRASSHNFIS